MASLPKDFKNFVVRLIEITKDIEGFLSEKEIKFLALIAACPTTKGEIFKLLRYLVLSFAYIYIIQYHSYRAT